MFKSMARGITIYPQCLADLFNEVTEYFEKFHMFSGNLMRLIGE